jgi:phosphorylase kinase alpha/beta subunit
MALKKRGEHKYNSLIFKHIKILQELQYSSGLFAASKKGVSTGYDKSWLRDNFYECLAFESVEDFVTVRKCYKAILSIFLKHEFKLDYAIAKKPHQKHEYIHARFNPETFEEFWEDWGNKQNDSIGSILFKIGELQTKHKIKIVETPDEFRVVQKLVYYLSSLKYWCDADSGMWEENEELHSSSVGACVAGLISVKKIKGIDVPEWLIDEGKIALNNLLPRESIKYSYDLSQLSLIWPYDCVSKKQTEDILSNVEYYLVKDRGVVRHKNDYYYNADPDGYSKDAEWTFGLTWLAIIYKKSGNEKKAKEYFDKAILAQNNHGEVPELYFSNSDKTNENTPLGWSESLFVVMLRMF